MTGRPMKRRRHLIADRAVRAHLVVVSTPSLAFSPRLVEAEEPVGVETLGAAFPVQAFDEGIVCRLTGPAKVERHTAHKGPQIELSADELRPVVEPDSLRVANFRANPFERCDDIGHEIADARRSAVTIG